MTTPAALRVTPSRGQHERPGKAGSAVLRDLRHFAPEALPVIVMLQEEFISCQP